MAEMISTEDIVNVKRDLNDIGECVNGNETGVVNPRLGDSFSTLPAAIASVENKGGYITVPDLSALNAIVPEFNHQVARTDDTGNEYRWNPVATPSPKWEATGKNYLNDAKAYADANGLFNPIIVPSNSTTLSKDFKTKGWYVFVSSAPAVAADLPEPTAGFLFVINSGNMIHQKWMPFNSNSEYTRSSNVSAVFPAFDKLITQNALDARLTAELAKLISKDSIDQYTIKPYDILTMSKNLYDESKKQSGIIVGNNGALQSAAGWSSTDFIPVVAGQFYTISFEAKRQNLAFYDQKGGVGLLAIEYNTSTANPLTVQAPVGAQYLVANLDSTTVTASKVQVELGQNATPYEPGGKQYKIDASYLSETTTLAHSLSIDGNNATLNGIVDGLPITMNMWLTKVGTAGELTVFNFAGDFVNNTLQRNLGDDVAPMRMNGATVGANHGYQKSDVTKTAHGKTTADIGSVWSSGGKEYVIVKIVSANVLSVTSRADNTAFALGELVHVSGATNTASFTPTATVSGSWFPVIRDRKLNCFVDDAQIDLSEKKEYGFKNSVCFLESYGIMKKSDIVEWLITHKGQDHANYDAVPAYTVSFSYIFDQECGCTIYFSGVGRKTVPLVDQMITQSIQLATGYGTVYNYIPKAVEFTSGGFTYNFSQLEDIRSKNPSSSLYLTSARQEIGTNPIDRLVMLNDQVGYATGYLPVLDAEPSARTVKASEQYLEIRNSTLKVYPRLIDSASITSINENDTFACIAYRKYFKRSAERTCQYVVRSRMGDYLYLDWHAEKIDEIELPADLVGRSFTVQEKSSNVTVLSQFASNTLLVKIDNTKNYGYLVLKFE